MSATGLKRNLMAFLLAVCCAIASAANALELNPVPEEVRQALTAWDKQILFRDDHYIQFSDGTEYVLIAPVEPSPHVLVKVDKTMPSGAARPDVIQLTDGHFLVRLVSLSSGRKTFPILDDLPISLRSGLLPQQFNFPHGFLLPTMWKALTGNLLTPVSEDVEQGQKAFPLAVFDGKEKQVALWDAGKTEVIRQFQVSCVPHKVILTPQGDEAFLACQEEPRLERLRLTSGQTSRFALKALASDMVLDPKTNRLYIAHRELPQLSVFNFQAEAFESSLQLKRPVRLLAWSAFRRQLYGVSLTEPKMEGAVSVKKKKNFFQGDEEKDPYEALQRSPHIQLVDLNTREVIKYIPSPEGVSHLYVQGEKMLWMVSEKEKTLVGFDLRWEEFTPTLILPELPLDIAEDGKWLYLLMPRANALYRFDSRQGVWAAPIALESGKNPKRMLLDVLEHQAFVTTQEQPGIQVINLSRGQWVGTQQTPFQDISQLLWAAPQSAMPDKQVTIKFQDGRLWLQNGQNRQWEGSLSDLRDLSKIHSQQAPSDPQTNP